MVCVYKRTLQYHMDYKQTAINIVNYTWKINVFIENNK